MKVTVFGSDGFIGANLKRRLTLEGGDTQLSSRLNPIDIRQHDLGHIIYCSGVTSDFRNRAIDTVEAHVSCLIPILRFAKFDSLTYLSSTRVYEPLGTNSRLVGIDTPNLDHLYNASKVAGEALCFAAAGARVHVVRLANVVGFDQSSHGFLDSIVRDALYKKHISLQTGLETSRDYVWIDDVIDMILAITKGGSRPIYDVGSGGSRTTGQLISVISKITKCTFSVSQDAPNLTFPAANVSALCDDFNYEPTDILDVLPKISQIQVAADKK